MSAAGGPVDDAVVVGVVLTVPAPWAQELRAARRASGDPEAATVPPHVTLLAPLAVPAADLAAVDQHLAGVAARHLPVELHLRGTATFRPVSPVVFVQVVEGISSCEQLAADVCSGPLAVPARFPYHPHVTVAHGVADDRLDAAFEAMAGFDARFTVGSIDRYAQDGAGWRLEHSFALGG